MRLLLSWICTLLLAVPLPMYGAYIYDLIRNQAWKSAMLHSVLAFVMMTGVFGLTWYGYTSPTRPSLKSTPSLAVLDKQDLEQEAALRMQKKFLKVGDLDRSLQVIKVKFDEAAYAQRIKDFQRALDVYEEIRTGADQNGRFFTFPSSCVMNNMAVAWFGKQENKGFEASGLLYQALHNQPIPKYQEGVIRQNYDSLDRYMNQ